MWCKWHARRAEVFYAGVAVERKHSRSIALATWSRWMSLWVNSGGQGAWRIRKAQLEEAAEERALQQLARRALYRWRGSVKTLKRERDSHKRRDHLFAYAQRVWDEL